MYYTLYDLINNLLFNGTALPSTIEGQALTLLTLVLSVVLIYFPFRMCISIVNGITEWRR